ncbi:hypothetical protein Dsin_017718 [Dipteronia sinensis]|uniref:Avr9/Cf-9 rapidly elicited protein n=1 Tax=Dipteronia sinensis TaxID=43782 RepID=A0AAE0AGS3_9ROSI|nr:hypothetical protein Dsin_017718 [Dipteronia sinensis]
MEASPPVIAKKMYKVLRTVLFMIQKGFTKSKIVGRALNDVVSHHYYTTLTGRSSRDMQHASLFVSPREYEFSCSDDSPASYRPSYVGRRRGGRARCPYGSSRNEHRYGLRPAADDYEDDAAAAAVEESPLVGPVGRHVRVTDSPFPLVVDDVDCHVDIEAEEFIQRFYKQLRLQKSRAANHYYS